MTKYFAILPALALVVALSSSALADNGTVSATALQEMGLAGIEIMSDDAAMAIRGKGYDGGGKRRKGKETKPWSMAYGSSWANIGGDDWDAPASSDGGYNSGGASAGTRDGYKAAGKYMAMGEHFSEAGKTVTKTHILEVKGLPATKETHVKSIRVFAGGFGNASSL